MRANCDHKKQLALSFLGLNATSYLFYSYFCDIYFKRCENSSS